MLLARQTLNLFSLSASYQQALEKLIDTQALPRLWAKDTSLWPSRKDTGQAPSENLAWLDLPLRLPEYLAAITLRSEVLHEEGFQNIVLVAFGTANLAARVVLHFSPFDTTRLFVLDTTDPASIRRFQESVDFAKTLFIFAAKSGKRIEINALLLYLLESMKASFIAIPGRHFVAVTEEQSYLSQLATQYQFRQVLVDPPNIKGRHSALLEFALLLVVRGMQPELLNLAALAMRDACAQHAPVPNPALQLASFLAAAASYGTPRVLLRSASALSPLTHCIGQLLAFCMGDPPLIVPLFRDILNSHPLACHNCPTVLLATANDPNATQALEELSRTNTPTFSIILGGPETLGPEVFKWQMATALASSILEADPFDDLSAHSHRDAALQILETIAVERKVPSSTVRIHDRGINLYAESITRQQISTLKLSEALRTFLNLCDPAGYIVLLTFWERTPLAASAIQELRQRMELSLQVPVQDAVGSGYLESLGYLRNGSASTRGLFMLLTTDPSEDVAIPGAEYTFGQLQLAGALGDFETLVRHNQLVLRLHFTQGIDDGLRELTAMFRETLSNIRSRA